MGHLDARPLHQADRFTWHMARRRRGPLATACSLSLLLFGLVQRLLPSDAVEPRRDFAAGAPAAATKALKTRSSAVRNQYNTLYEARAALKLNSA